MAEELTVTLAAAYSDANDVTGQVEVNGLVITLATAKLLHNVTSVLITQTAIDLGDIASLGFAVFVNLDVTNYIELQCATSGTIFAKLFPKGSTSGINFAVVHLGSGAQAPFAIANSATCLMETFICPL